MTEHRLLAVAITLLLAACQPLNKIDVTSSPEIPQIQETVAPKTFDSREVIEKGSSVYTLLKRNGLTPQAIKEVVKVAKEHVSLDRVSEGAAFLFSWADEARKDLLKIEFQPSPVSSLVFTPEAETNKWKVESIEHPVEVKRLTFAGTVKSNLWESASEAGMDGSLIGPLAEIFAWQIDFAREVQPGDRWRLTVEQKFVNEKFIGWGNILVAEYEKNGSDLYTGVRFPQEGPRGSYYFPDGSSLRRMFLKSPIKFARITSKFNRNRFHPIYKRRQPHNGVDYGAPFGTPVMSVGDGRVEFVGTKGAGGKTVRIRHNSLYQTAYLHLQGYAKNIRKGSKVSQGQVIGYVGATGAATGPHLHFAFYESNQYVDPLGRKFPSADPVASASMSAFKQVVASAINFLPDWQLAAHTEPQDQKQVLE